MHPVTVGLFGWGVVAPKSPNIDAFCRNLASSQSWLAPFHGFGPGNFLAGVPEFNFSDYQEWIGHRFAPRHFQRLREKMDMPAQYAIGAFIQSLTQNPGIEKELQDLGAQAHVYVGTGLGSLGTVYEASLALDAAQRRWDRFWSSPERNSELREYLAGSAASLSKHADAPSSPDTLCDDQREAAEHAWLRYWMARSPELHEYLAELARIDGSPVEGEIEKGKLAAMRERDRGHARLQEKWGTPTPPWTVSADVIWNIHNTPAAQISILGKITGLAFAPVAACSTFGVALRLAMNAIRSGEAKAVVVGATDPPPHPLTVGSFYSARVLSADANVSVPLTRLQGTHISGGSVVWILGDMNYWKARGYRPIGMEPLAVGVSSDADHIITPSTDGPRAAIQQALRNANAAPGAIGTWDLHATGTPGDYSEVSTLRSIFPDSVLVTARKGLFGHGMSAGGGWELTAQYLGYMQRRLFPTALCPEDLNEQIAGVHGGFVFDSPREFPEALAGKLSMGIGGINACVISRPLER